MGVCKLYRPKEGIFTFRQLFTELKLDNFEPRYSQKREKRPCMWAWVWGGGVYWRGGLYWGFYGIQYFDDRLDSLVELLTSLLHCKSCKDTGPKSKDNPSVTSSIFK